MNLLPAMFLAVAAVVALAATSIFLQGQNFYGSAPAAPLGSGKARRVDAKDSAAEEQFWLGGGDDESGGKPRATRGAEPPAIRHDRSNDTRATKQLSRKDARNVVREARPSTNRTSTRGGHYPSSNRTTATSAGHYHDYGVLLVMYHKTGYVLTRFLVKSTIGLEYEARGKSEEEIKEAKSVMGKSVEHVDETTGKQIAFGQRGNWNSNFVFTRRHNGVSGCPMNFKLGRGAIYLQEAPDFFCGDQELAERMLGLPKQKRGRAKIVHFVRNPFSMVLSNYFYHAAKPTPEKWVHEDKPCEINYENGESLASHVLPVLGERTKITRQQLDAVAAMCRSLYNEKNGTFYEHLLAHNHWDGLRLATAQMIISSSAANKHKAGGDVLRMASNVIKFQNLQSSSSVPTEQRERIRVLTISMDAYQKHPRSTTLRYLNFVLGEDDSLVSSELRSKMATAQKKTLNSFGNSSHVTQGKHEDKEELRQLLREDPVLGPILSEVEILVDDALSQSKELAPKRKQTAYRTHV